MTVSSMDLNGRAALLAAEANAALGAGDTLRAAELFKEAGETLETKVPGMPKKSEKDLVRFLAATQYYHAGMYARAEGLSRKIQAELLPSGVRGVFEKFRRDLEARSGPAYPDRVKRLLRQAWEGKQFAKVLEILQDHAYVLPAGDMAFLRACCCEGLANYRAAALFFADAIKFKPNDVDVVFTLAGHPLYLLGENKLAEAWEYVAHQRAALRHAIPNASASLLRFHQASQATTAEVRKLTEDQIRYCSTAWELYHEMPPDHQKHPFLREFMALCLEATVFGRLRLSDGKGALDAANRAVDFNPSSFAPWTVRGIVTYPAREAVFDFTKAIQLGDKSYSPYYYLAHRSFMRDEFVEAVSWCEQALQHDPSRRLRAQLLEMLAIARSHLGCAPGAIEPLFAQAQQLDPENQRIQNNRTVFQQMVATATTKAAWDRGSVEKEDELDKLFTHREHCLSDEWRRASPTQQELATVFS